jgi:hypothetical protein
VPIIDSDPRPRFAECCGKPARQSEAFIQPLDRLIKFVSKSGCKIKETLCFDAGPFCRRAVTVSDFVNNFGKAPIRTNVLYTSYLLAIAVATVGWVSLLAWLAMAMIGD